MEDVLVVLKDDSVVGVFVFVNIMVIQEFLVQILLVFWFLVVVFLVGVFNEDVGSFGFVEIVKEEFLVIDFEIVLVVENEEEIFLV